MLRDTTSKPVKSEEQNKDTTVSANENVDKSDGSLSIHFYQNILSCSLKRAFLIFLFIFFLSVIFIQLLNISFYIVIPFIIFLSFIIIINYHFFFNILFLFSFSLFPPLLFIIPSTTHSENALWPQMPIFGLGCVRWSRHTSIRSTLSYLSELKRVSNTSSL